MKLSIISRVLRNLNAHPQPSKMSLHTIYVTRHGFRSNWAVERDTGIYRSNIPSPTGIPSDPALAGYGAIQSQELAEKLVTLYPPIERFYSSPFYRCIQTLYPTVCKLAAQVSNDVDASADRRLQIYGDNGLGEWFGTAHFDHPSPAEPRVLHRLFPSCYDVNYTPTIVPDTKGETIDALHDRTAYALHRIIERCDREGVKAIVICTHAATLYAVGRALTGRMPRDVAEEDFYPYTCGLSRFERRSRVSDTSSQDTSRHTSRSSANGDFGRASVAMWQGVGSPIPAVHWRDGRGVAGGWDCVLNGDCSFLGGGEERGWRFSGDESFLTSPTDAAGVDAGAGLGVVVEGKKGRGGGEAGMEARKGARL